MAIHLVAAQAENHVIGRGIEIPWRVKGEQKLFKQITMGGTLIMGRITYDSIGRPLPGRKTIIVTSNLDYAQKNCLIAHSMEEALSLAAAQDKETYIVGGGEIYRQSIENADVIHLTTIHTEVEGDVFFPAQWQSDFELKEEKQFESNINYTYRCYRRIKTN
jgi:dihydrofolate reductase